MTETTKTKQEATIEKHIQNRNDRIAKILDEEIPRREVARKRYQDDVVKIINKQVLESDRFGKTNKSLEFQRDRIQKKIDGNRDRSLRTIEELKKREDNANQMVTKVENKIEFFNNEIERLTKLNARAEEKLVEIRTAKEESDVHIGDTES